MSGLTKEVSKIYTSKTSFGKHLLNLDIIGKDAGQITGYRRSI